MNVFRMSEILQKKSLHIINDQIMWGTRTMLLEKGESKLDATVSGTTFLEKASPL